MRFRVAGLLMAAATAMPAAAQTVSAGDVTIRLTGRVHVQFNTTGIREADAADPDVAGPVTGSTFELRRARVAAELELGDWITGMIEPDVAASELRLRHAFINFGFSSSFQLRTGQFKKPFSLIELTSSLETPMIERGLEIRHLAEAYERADGAGTEPVLSRFQGNLVLGEEQLMLFLLGFTKYDIGAMAHGEVGAFGYQAGVFNGAGADLRDDTDGKAWATRLTWKAALQTPVRVGTAVSYSERSSGDTGLADGVAFGADLELGAFRRGGLHLLAEVVGGESPAVDERFLAGQAMAAWWWPLTGPRVDGLEVAARTSWGDPDRSVSGDEGTLLSSGINLYMRGQNRLMFNWDRFVPGGERFRSVNAVRVQAQIAF